MTTDDDARVGLRVQVGADKATVRYLGPVEGQEGEWAGVEWDDASRGKHDGCAGGRRYFQTARGANSGSFVRLGKVDWGVAAPEALVRRYQGLYGPPEDGDDENWEEMYVQTAGNRRRGVELVGMEKVHRRQSDMLRLRAAVLRGCRVASGGPAGEVARLVPNVEELDLSDNLITSWDVVVQIARQLSRLEVLNLSKNRLSFPESQEPSHGSLLECLKTLILKECDNSWGQVLDLLPHVPSLTSLHICYNSLSSLSSTTAGYDALRKLELLDLECNNICSWEEVWPLNTLPALKRLHLGSNPISNITYPKSHSLDVPPFPALQCLLLGDCLVGDWASVDSLNRFPSLVETRLTGNPLIKSTHGGGRFEIIARIARLTLLNGATVTPIERFDCELRYMSLAHRDTLSSATPNGIDPELHPRMAELLEKHGPVCTRGNVAASTGTLQDSVVQVSLTCVAASVAKSMGTVTKRLPASMTLANLKRLAEKLFKLDVAKMALYMKTSSSPMPESMPDLDSLQLCDFDIQDGQEILVEERQA